MTYRIDAATAIAASAALLCAASSAALAQEAGAFYKDKTVKIIVGHQPGTGFDVYGRALAPFLARHLPGKPTVIVQNMNGASGIRALNYLANIAPKDGTELGTMVFTAPFEPLLGEGKGKFDGRNLTWIGSMDSSVAVCGVSRKSGIKHFDDLFTKELRIGATGRTGPFRTTPTALKRLLGIKLNIIAGYKGSVAVRQAILRGEVDGACGPSMSAVRVAFKELTNRGDFNIILQASKNTDPELKGVPQVYSYAKSDDDKKVFDLIFGIQRLGRVFVAPPGLPADRAAALRKAFDDSMKDKDLIALAKKTNLSMNVRPAAEVAQIVKETYDTPSHLVERARKAISR
ncbi:MAG: hypothetical protein KDJ29_07095 [Hyphomicrobiales bacterium]|nr:hypothetical protein [Hyphomicrobiales bacterium]